MNRVVNIRKESKNRTAVLFLAFLLMLLIEAEMGNILQTVMNECVNTSDSELNSISVFHVSNRGDWPYLNPEVRPLCG